MSYELWIDRQGSLLRAAVVRGRALVDLYIDSRHLPTQVGAVFVGRVASRLAGGEAYIDLGGGQLGYCDSAPDGEPAFLVQITRDATDGKQAKVSADVSLAGRLVVALSRGSKVRVPQDHEFAKEAARTVLGGLGCGFILRSLGARLLAESGAQGPGAEAIKAEAQGLAAELASLRAGLADRQPRCLRPAPDAITRASMAYAGQLTHIRADSTALADVGRREAERHLGQPGLFELIDLEGAIAALASPHVPLPGGGALVIEPTEALVAVDVNAGNQPPDAVNLALAPELARQLRLRNLAGTIIVDLIDNPPAATRTAILNALTNALADDPCGAVVHGITRLGLVEITRTQRGQPLHRVIRAAHD